MAKRYARINWQDYPSVTTPRNAANLNKMDKGIDDLDNAIEALNDNLAVTNSNVSGKVSKTLTLTTNWLAITETGFYKSAVGTANAPNGSANAMGMCIYYDVNWVVLIAYDFNTVTPRLYKNLKIGGSWNGWSEL